MPVSKQWHKWLAEYRRRQAIDNLPARFTPSLVEGGAFIGRWLAGTCGIGAALSISAMFSTYASLTSVDADHICIASQFASRTMREGRTAALDFIAAGVLGLIAASIPRLILVFRNSNLHDLFLENTQPIHFEQWFSEYSETKVGKIFLLSQFIPLLIAANFFLAGLNHAFGPQLSLSAAAIQSLWHTFKGAC